MKRVLMMLLLLLSLVSACAPDPRRQAKAEAIVMAAEQEALDQAQAREQSQALNEMEMRRQLLTMEDAYYTAETHRMQQMFLMQISAIALAIGMLALALAFGKGVYGVSHAIVQAAQVRANLIPLDAKTRQFPLLVQHVHGTRYAIHNPNVGSVLMLDARNEADRQLIATAGATQIAGVIGQEARQSEDPAGLALMQPPIVSARDEVISVGRELLK